MTCDTVAAVAAAAVVAVVVVVPARLSVEGKGRESIAGRIWRRVLLRRPRRSSACFPDSVLEKCVLPRCGAALVCSRMCLAVVTVVLLPLRVARRLVRRDRLSS